MFPLQCVVRLCATYYSSVAKKIKQTNKPFFEGQRFPTFLEIKAHTLQTEMLQRFVFFIWKITNKYVLTAEILQKKMTFSVWDTYLWFGNIVKLVDHFFIDVVLTILSKVLDKFPYMQKVQRFPKYKWRALFWNQTHFSVCPCVMKC